jgi:hypothetical protein
MKVFAGVFAWLLPGNFQCDLNKEKKTSSLNSFHRLGLFAGEQKKNQSQSQKERRKTSAQE